MGRMKWIPQLVFLCAIFADVSSSCSLTEYQCKSGQCIPFEKRCNAFYDCDDATDEEHCPGSLNIENCEMPAWFKCKGEKCVSSLFVCDGQNDCPDGDDETNCNREEKEVECFGDDFACLDKKKCINAYWVCDSTPDCFDGSDETVHCSHMMNCSDGFRCKNGHCIIKEFECDGDNDCMDNSDEESCEHKFVHPDHCDAANGYFLCHDGVACIENKFLCDNFSHCFDKSDEANCGDSSQCKNKKCSHGCHVAPGGAVCTCPKGYQLDSTLLNCTDVDECSHFGSCSQSCKNTVGGFQCECDIGYHLDVDHQSCKVTGGGDPLLIFTTSSHIRGQSLHSHTSFSILQNLNQHQISCISHTGHFVYWAQINKGEERIMRCNEDGTEEKVIIDSGLGVTEDMDIDYITGNIYFTDSGYRHIGVCTSDGMHCAVLINQDIHKPRAIALNPRLGMMYWSDWGRKPMIAKSHMDGAMAVELITENIHWPNGMTIDFSNDRIYWVDAKLHSVSTAKLDGTDRREVLKNIVRHPYAIGVFEDSLYFSDWERREVLKSNKFTGKNLTVVFKESEDLIFGVHVYHSSLYPRANNPCRFSLCQGICLLKPAGAYACACSEDEELQDDHHSCRKILRKNEIAFVTDRRLQVISQQTLGKHKIEKTDLSDISEVSAIAYNSLSDVLLIADASQRIVYEMNLETKLLHRVLTEGVGKIISMSHDNYTNNLYVCDGERHILELWSLNTVTHITISQYVSGHQPIAVVVAPNQRKLFVAVKWPDDDVHIKQISIDGTESPTLLISQTVMGKPVYLSFDSVNSRLYWTNPFFKSIESANVNGSNHTAVVIAEGEASGLVVFNETVFWSQSNSPNLFYYAPSMNDRYVVTESDWKHTPLIAGLNKVENGYHPCRYGNNGGCSHICLAGNDSSTWSCICPKDMLLLRDNKTCTEYVRCDSTKFKCTRDNFCIAKILRCDGGKDCSDGEDEENCEVDTCKDNQFRCNNGQCIRKEKRCDNEFNCSDKSDEVGCINTCDAGMFPCGSGECIPGLYVCDHENDCKDGSDEHSCEDVTCAADKFMCKSGQCIPGVWECDKDLDCMDMTDEHEQCKTTCNEGYHTCHNGDCIHMSLVCNGMNDCGDNSDEFGCSKRKKVCKNDEFMCSDADQICLPLEAKCNLTTECPKGEDETDCALCSRGDFQCRNKKCVNRRWLCDGDDDCGDSSDEEIQQCLANVPLPNVVKCAGFDCGSGICIPHHLVCNNATDCSDGSDEGTFCATACSHHICDGECIPLPTGGVCKCKPGFLLESDGHTCTDIDECLEDRCSQTCENVPGSFVCGCREDYLLKKDQVSCKSEGGKMSFIMENGDEIKVISGDFHQVSSPLYEPGDTIYGMDVDSRKRLLYWTSGTSGALNVLKLEDGGRSYITGIGRPGKLSLDWITGNLFYIDRPREIAVCNLLHRKCSRVISVEEGAIISSLAVDPFTGYIFYTKAIHSGLHRPYSKLYRLDIATQNVTLLAANDITWVSGMVIDHFRQVLYWSDLFQQTVEKIDFNGTQRLVVLQKDVRRPESLAIFEDSLFWLSKGSGEVTQCHIYGENKGDCTTTNLHQYDAKSLLIHDIANQPKGINLCQNITCDAFGLCVRTPQGPRCLCEDGTVADEGKKCMDMNFVEKGRSRNPAHDNPQYYNSQQPMSNTSTVFLTIFLTISTMISILALYIFFQKKKSSGLMLQSIHFRNPTFGVSHSTGEFHPQLLTPGQHEYVNHTSPTLVQHPNGGLSLADSKEPKISRKMISFQDCEFDSDSSDHYEDVDMKANLLP